MFSYEIDENLKLVLPLSQHAEELTVVVRANIERLRPWMPWATEDYSIDSAREFINLNLKTFAEEGSFSACAVLDEKIVGMIGFHKLDLNNKSAHIGYWLAREAEGRGLMTRCCRVLIEYLFDELKLNRIQINCNVENVKSRAIPERLGFQLEGVHRQVEFFDNRFGDWAIYALLREDWEEKRQK